MTIEVAVLISIVSVSFAVFFGISNRNRAVKKDTEEEAKAEGAVLIKLENIQNGMTEVKMEMKGYREEVKSLTETNIRNQESLKSLHHRVDTMEKIMNAQTHEYRE